MSKQVSFSLKCLLMMIIIINGEYVELFHDELLDDIRNGTINGDSFNGWTSNGTINDETSECHGDIAILLKNGNHLTVYPISALNIYNITVSFEICEAIRAPFMNDDYVSFQYTINGSWFELRKIEQSDNPTGIFNVALPTDANNVDNVGIRFIMDASVNAQIYLYNLRIFGYQMIHYTTNNPTIMPTITSNNPTLTPSITPTQRITPKNETTNIYTSISPSITPTTLPTSLPTLSRNVNTSNILPTSLKQNVTQPPQYINNIMYGVSHGIDIQLIIIIFTIALLCVLGVLCFTIVLLRHYMKAKEKLEKDFADHHNRIRINTSSPVGSITSAANSPVPSPFEIKDDVTPMSNQNTYKVEMVKKVSFYIDKTSTPSNKSLNEIEGDTIITSTYNSSKSPMPLENIPSSSILHSPGFNNTPGN
mmetsp:Transcript_60427/g.74047  ORF Transcript_60427/g.74047 Transcript_60427/m.74047 type:complete len:422 (-) Transcript_60427:85-1350(-)